MDIFLKRMVLGGFGFEIYFVGFILKIGNGPLDFL